MFSICIITRNEADKLELCLKELNKYPLEIVVVDTGSSDNTIMVAQEYTDQVYRYNWNNDFSSARNYAIGKAHNPWIIMIDTDECVDSFDYEAALKIIEFNSDKVGRINRINVMNRADGMVRQKERINRVFLKSKFFYKGRIHEQLESVTGLDYETFLFPMTIKHTGYQGTRKEINAKADRNIELLKDQLNNQKKNGKEDPYTIYQLGKSYYMKQDYNTALVYFEQATAFDLNPRLEYVLDLIIAYGYTLLYLKRYDIALNFIGIYNEFSYSADFIFLMGLIYMNNALFDAAVAEFLKASEKKDYMVEGTNSYLAFYNIGVIYECLGNIGKAKRYYNLCGEYDKAKKRLKEYES